MSAGEVLPRVVILGCGYLGQALAERAVARGWTVEALTRNVDQAFRLRGELGIGAVESDLASDAWHGLLNPEGAWVVDCVSSGGGGVAGYRSSYLGGAESIVRWLRARGAPVGLIYTGSTSVYAQSQGEWVTELSETAPTTTRHEVLLATEATFGRAVADGLLPRAAILRLAGLYGPGRHFILDRLREGETTFPGSGEYYLNLIHRDDAARAVESLIKHWSGSGLEIFNCADGEPALKAVVAQWAAREMGLPPPLFRPDEVSARARRRATPEGVVPHRRICADKLGKTTGWTPRYEDFRAGYRELLAESETGEAS